MTETQAHPDFEAAAVKVTAAGIDDFVIIERATGTELIIEYLAEHDPTTGRTRKTRQSVGSAMTDGKS